MKNRLHKTILYLGALSVLALPLSTFGAKLYRWVDNEGNVHFSDKVPPEHAHRERNRFDEHGVKVEKIERAKTPEEIAKEKALEELRAEQQRIIEEQKAIDRVLLRTFRSEDDIIMARDGKLAALDVLIQVAEGGIRRLKQTLTNLQQEAANQERQTGYVGKLLQDRIEATRKQLEEGYASILEKEAEKEKITKKHQIDLDRFRKLKNLEPKKAEQQKSKKKKIALLDSLVTCENTTACNMAWSKAEQYVKQHATTPMQMVSEKVVMTAPPRRDNEFSITISRIPDKESTGASIFLDVQCRTSTAKGIQLCNSDKVKKIRQGFRPALGTQ